MAYMDTGEDELDYEGEDFVDREDLLQLASPRCSEAIGALAEDEIEEEDDYEDLYHDVDVGFFESSAAGENQGLMKGNDSNGDQGCFQKENLGYGDASSDGARASRSMIFNQDGVERSEEKALWRISKAGLEMQSSQAATAAVREGKMVDEAETDEYGISNIRSNKEGDADIPLAKPSEAQGDGDSSHQDRTVSDDNDFTEEELVRVSEETRASQGQARGQGVASNAGRSLAATTGKGDSSTRSQGSPSRPGNIDAGSRQGGARPVDGRTSVFVGEIHWWTTDAELEAALSEYGRVKCLKFFEERASGKSKGYCLVEFFDAAAAHLCKDKMEGKVFNGRACVVAFPSRNQAQINGPQISRNQAPSALPQGQVHGPIKRVGDRGMTGRGGAGSQTGIAGRSGYGKMGMSTMGGGRGQTPGRGRGRAMGGNAPYSQGHPGPMGGPAAAAMMAAQGMMGQGYDAGFGPPMGRQNMGAMGYGMGHTGGFVQRAPSYPPMGPPYPGAGPGLPGVAPHVNPAFFGRGSNGTAMGKMGGGAMNGSFRGWDGSISGWGGDENERWMREGDYGEEMGSGEYGHGAEMSTERTRSVQSRDRSKATDGDWVNWRRKGAKDAEWDREKHNECESFNDQQEGDWDGEVERPQRIRSKSRVAEEDEPIRYREEEHGKRRRYVGDRKIEQ